MLELLLNFVEPLLTGGRVALEQPTRCQQVQRCAGLRLQEAVVKVTRHAHAFLERPGILKATQQVESVEARCREARHELAHGQLVERRSWLIEAEDAAADQLAVERPGLHRPHVELCPQPFVDGAAAPPKEPSAREHNDAACSLAALLV